MDTIRIQQPHRAGHDHQDDGTHACTVGWITLGRLVVDPGAGEESEQYAPYLC